MLNRRYLPPRLVSEWMPRLISVLVLNAIISFLPGISWAAHFGGGAVGFLVSAALNQHRFGRGLARWVFLVIVPVIPVVCVGAVMRATNSDARFAKHNGELKPQEESEDDKRDEAERKTFNKLLLPAIQNAKDQAVRALQTADDLRQQNAEARNANQVAPAVKRLTAAREKLTAVLLLIQTKEPFESEHVGQAVKLAKNYCNHASTLILEFEQCLTKGDQWTKDEDDALNREKIRTDEAFQKFDEKLSN
jgi:hypothetical protein